MSIYCCDEKFGAISSALNKRGWTRVDFTIRPDTKKMIIPSETQLVWTNLQTIDFRGVFRRIVNHLKGSNHLSNKALLMAGLSQSNNLNICPPTWTPLSSNAPELIYLIVCNSLYCAAKKRLIHESVIDEDINLLQRIIADVPKQLGGSHAIDAHNLMNILLDSEATKDELCEYLLAIELSDPRKKYCGESDIWIIKPVGLSCGENITVVRGWRETIRTAEAHNFKCVVQKYIEHPLLVRLGRKFDIRQWVLVTSLNPLVVYGFSDFYLRLSSCQYSLADLSSRVHLCNHSIQRLHTTECQSKGITDIPSDEVCDTMMSSAEFFEYLLSDGIDNERINQMLTAIKSTCIKAIVSSAQHMEKIGQGFEWLGFDLMVSETLEIILIEVNVSPDLSPSTPITAKLVDAASNDLFSMIIDDDCLNITDLITLKNIRTKGESSIIVEGHDGRLPRWLLWDVIAMHSTTHHIKTKKVTKETIDYQPKYISDCARAFSVINQI